MTNERSVRKNRNLVFVLLGLLAGSLRGARTLLDPVIEHMLEAVHRLEERSNQHA
jgi:hypothetical protein